MSGNNPNPLSDPIAWNSILQKLTPAISDQGVNSALVLDTGSNNIMNLTHTKSEPPIIRAEPRIDLPSLAPGPNLAALGIEQSAEEVADAKINGVK
jgi:hypothetical protein